MTRSHLHAISSVSKRAGISVRTLHYYAEIGLLDATFVNAKGYRFYDETALIKLQRILFLKALGFELKQIKSLLTDTHYDMLQELTAQRTILDLKKQHLEGLITLIDKQLIEKTEIIDLEVFNTMKIDTLQHHYTLEAEQKWGHTEAYATCARKTKTYTKEKWKAIMSQSDAILKAIGTHRTTLPSDSSVQALVQAWRNHITEHYYDCTLDIFKGLGEMYIADERFTQKIDQHGEGTAAFLSQAISYYCTHPIE